MDPNPAAFDETIRPPNQLIGQHRSCIGIAVASAARFIAKNMVQLGPLRIDVAAVQAIHRDRSVNQDTAADGIDSEAEIEVCSGPEILQRRIVGKQAKRVAAKAIARCRRPDPLMGEANKPNRVEHAPVEIFPRPNPAGRMLVGAHRAGLDATAGQQDPVESVLGPKNDLIAGHLEHVAGCKSDVNAQRQMDEDMCLDAPWEEKIVGVEKNDIWPFRRGQSFQRRRGLTAVFGTADNLHTRIARLDRLQHGAAFVARGIVDDDTFDIWIGLTQYGLDRRP